jgi:hypothetical protein
MSLSRNGVLITEIGEAGVARGTAVGASSKHSVERACYSVCGISHIVVGGRTILIAIFSLHGHSLVSAAIVSSFQGLIKTGDRIY